MGSMYIRVNHTLIGSFKVVMISVGNLTGSRLTKETTDRKTNALFMLDNLYEISLRLCLEGLPWLA